MSKHNRLSREMRAAKHAARAEDGVAGMAWWNGLTDYERVCWMARAGNTGVVADAWEAFKRNRAAH